MFFGGGTKMVMKSSRVILSCLISTLLSTVVSADWLSLTGDPVSLSSLQGKSLDFGDKEFSDFGLFGFGTGGANAPTTDSVFVQGGQDSSSGDYGLRFLLSANAASNQTVNANLSFTISVLPTYGDYFIDDVSLILSGASATGTGVVNTAETVWNSFPGGNVVASLSCSKQQGDNGANLADYASFNPLKQIYIQSKDISISGGTNGTAHISELFQYYSQVPVPEPATITLLGFAGVIMLRKRHRR
jgi:hypothetical protein